VIVVTIKVRKIQPQGGSLDTPVIMKEI
jgi:hypothetical protein